MNLLIFSDLHLDFYPNNGKDIIKNLRSKNVDVAICAGDLCAKLVGLECGIRKLAKKYKKLIYVTGNHEYYHKTSFIETEDLLVKLEKELPNFHWLENKRIEINGVGFLGGTLWFKQTMLADRQKKYFSDFSYIPGADPELFCRHEKTVEFIDKNAKPGDILITHHLPTEKSIGLKYQGDTYNCFFATDLDKIIFNKQPALAIHGHTHFNFDYSVGSTRVYCNPLGYPHENFYFMPGQIIKV